ncbi:hypothetical protein COCSUDRAFT_44977 [Coccomyxa subellipsoidea C-169]|uniref:Activating signal cointegrator 1 third domain-containing protein n=1 Tax=Coccomyxa subellipsoidea (strain C-169) TaxID=574566 RepID=I0YK89_COCSC|nr:hypothetical protein COCSUDRAFT_44977 [Coccomyxa subellipsoidea C-169]EIE18808.1 hypothetical protein COCSUDRAFT_44977 [Coccomyxa subellipsoidea C-169]|eukprot:XP_005643352.1 hypothetical protein COCSUDRAFT_44977 [Coccomyxa subellipsoidea C-169]
MMQAAARERPAGSMTIKHTQKRKGAQAAAAETDASALDRAVANCLCCGKVYMCRETTNDASLFVESGGVCTFCGAKVALSSQESSHARPPYAERVAAPASQEQPASSALAGSAVDDSAAEAVALKNRLVDYDRNAAKRTTVVDDQSDFFEIDSNAWLSDEERQQLKERQRAIEEAEQSRRRAVTVTFDLLGRQVILTGDEQPVSTSDTEASSAAGPFAAANTSAQPPQSVGPSAHTGVDEDRHVQDTPRVLRIRPNPTLHGPAPVFMRRTNGPGKGVAQPSGRQQRPSNGQLQNSGAGRLQHDDAFVASFGALSVSS